VTALLNVVILVGMFWFASSSFVLQPGVQVRLPEAPFLDGSLYNARTLAVTAQGLMFYNDRPINFPALERLFAAESAARTGSSVAPILVEADAGTPYDFLMRIYTLAVCNGIDNMVLATRPPPMAPAP
jgi:biopolymer transport protein ExbD